MGFIGTKSTSLSSNLTTSISTDDLNFRGSRSAVKREGTFGKPSMLSFGLNYSAITGKPRILPSISYVLCHVSRQKKMRKPLKSLLYL
ncbi:MAG: hypothetical protein HRT69_12455 [Flavobacteriaceae bacterium]|nr:hypothetical protein [Flavobacteriaceae bacterium]